MQIPETIEEIFHLLDPSTIPFNHEDNEYKVSSFIDYFLNGNELEQELIRERVAHGDYRRLTGYSWRMANQAIRRWDVGDIRRGVAAIVLEGGRQNYRDSIVSLCLLYHSALKLSIDPYHIFSNLARLGTGKAESLVAGYLASGEKSIEAMSFKEGVDENGAFKYVVVA